MKKWRKRILWSFVTLVVLLLAGGGVLFYYTKLNPDWYRSKKLTAAEAQANRKSAEDKLVLMKGWAQSQTQWPKIGTRPRVDTDPTTPPSNTSQLVLSEDELNALLDNFEQPLLERYGQYISDPYVAIREERIILAVTIKDANRVLSVYLNPKLDEKGMLTLEIDKLKAGRLTIPHALWGSYTDKLAELLKPVAQKTGGNARMEADGTASAEAALVERTRLLLNSLNGKPSDAVIFLPTELEHWEQGYPAKVMDIKIEDQKLTLTVSRLTQAEQDQLIQRIRPPYGEEPEPAIVGNPGKKESE